MLQPTVELRPSGWSDAIPLSGSSPPGILHGRLDQPLSGEPDQDRVDPGALRQTAGGQGLQHLRMERVAMSRSVGDDGEDQVLESHTRSLRPAVPTNNAARELYVR